MRVRILRRARLSLSEGYSFYEKQQTGLGSRFVESIISEIRSLRIYGGGHPIVHKEFHRMVCKVFPFSIFYKVEHSEINVYGVYDNRRDSEWISERLN